MIEHTNDEPYPDVVLASQFLRLVVVYGMLEVVFADSEQHLLICVKKMIHLSPSLIPKF